MTKQEAIEIISNQIEIANAFDRTYASKELSKVLTYLKES